MNLRINVTYYMDSQKTYVHFYYFFRKRILRKMTTKLQANNNVVISFARVDRMISIYKNKCSHCLCTYIQYIFVHFRTCP